MVQPATAPSRDDVVRAVVPRARRQRRARHPGQARAVHLALVCLLRRGPPPHRGRARRRQDVAGQGDRAARSAAPGTASSSRPTCCRPTSPASRSGTARSGEFEFRPGGVFANVVLADEINRASPKTQSALLEAMEERQVTVDAHTLPARRAVHGHRHPEPDRARGHLSPARGAARPLPHAHPRWATPTATPRSRSSSRRAQPPSRSTSSHRSSTRDDVAEAAAIVASVHVAPELRGYIVDLVDATRRHPDLVLGASPRGALVTAARRSRARGQRRPRLRDARRREARRARRCSSTACSLAPDAAAARRHGRRRRRRDPRLGAGSGRDGRLSSLT